MSIESAESASIPTSAPWLPEEQWKAGDSGSFYGDGAHTITNNAYYCVDFNWYGDNGDGNYDRGAPILAVANGTVTVAHPWNGDPNSDPLGNRVRINHGSYESLYAHLNTTPIVVENQVILKGQVIGFVGATGTTSPHLHHCLYQKGVSVEPNPIDGQVLSDGALITSRNTNLFDETYNRFVESLIGNKEGLPHWYYNWNNTDLYDSARNEVPNNIYIQDLQGGEWWDGAIVYDALGGARQAYLIRSGFWLEWSKDSWGLQQGGPRSKLGAPITEEYEYPSRSGKKRQDFQLGYLAYDSTKSPTVTIPQLQVMPGMYVNGWHPDTSYAFAEAYVEKGMRDFVGEPFDNGGGTYVHNWNGVWIQDFHLGKYGDDGQSAIIYNPNNNKAYLVLGGFWGHYKTNNGPFELGAPLGDEQYCVCTDTQCVDAQQVFEKGTLQWTPLKGVYRLNQGYTLQKTKLLLALPSNTNSCQLPPWKKQPAPPQNLQIR